MYSHNILVPTKMSKLFFLVGIMLLMCCYATSAQDTLRVKIKLHPDSTFAISPYIYGVNYQHDYHQLNIGSRRLGGARMSTYNWETNASNAGTSWQNFSDDYFCNEFNIDYFEREDPAKVVKTFHDSSRSVGAYSLITVPMIGYVAADKFGSVVKQEQAPSKRWIKIENHSPGKFPERPNLSDNVVYTDEFINFLKKEYGKATSKRGIKGYALDNETELWSLLIPYARYLPIQCHELIEISVNTSRAIKKVDQSAEVFGPALYGFEAYRNLQNAFDWGRYYEQGFKNFIQYYLHAMKEAEDSVGFRLLDVLDVHWYPEAKGTLSNGFKERIIVHDNDEKGLSEARIQAPRTLWDSTYQEDSYISKHYSSFTLLPWLQKEIAQFYPGTKLAISEYEFGGSKDISGGLALVDVLGVFGKYGVYMANLWGPIDGYVASAFKLFRNYDGYNSSFGNIGIATTTTDVENTSIYASRRKYRNKEIVHLIILNKNWEQHARIDLDIEHLGAGKKVKIYGFDNTSQEVRYLAKAKMSELAEIVLPPLSAYHLEISE
jgi:mannan endo-1,4-beta-mannosidase